MCLPPIDNILEDKRTLKVFKSTEVEEGSF